MLSEQAFDSRTRYAFEARPHVERLNRIRKSRRINFSQLVELFKREGHSLVQSFQKFSRPRGRGLAISQPP